MNARHVLSQASRLARIVIFAMAAMALLLALPTPAGTDWWQSPPPPAESSRMAATGITTTPGPTATPSPTSKPTSTATPAATAIPTRTTIPGRMYMGVPPSTPTRSIVLAVTGEYSPTPVRRLDGSDPDITTRVPTRTSTSTAIPATSEPVLPSRISSLNGRFLLLNMHGMLFHDNLADISEDVAYAKWMGAGVIRVLATDNNSGKAWSGGTVGNRIADIAPHLRAAGVKLIVPLVNNHRAVPGELPESAGWMDGYQQLLLPFYTKNWRGAYLTFARELISTVRARGAQDVVFAWEVGNELHTPQDVQAIVPFMKSAVAEIRKLDPETPILPGTMGAWHLQPWVPTSDIARWLYCDAPVDAYTLHAYDWVNWDRQGDMPISFDFDNILKPCQSGRTLPVIVEELGTSRQLANVYASDQEGKRLEQERNQLRFVLNYPNIVGIGAWSAESPRVRERVFFDNQRGLTSYGTDATGGGSCYDPAPMSAPGVRCQLEQMLRALPARP